MERRKSTFKVRHRATLQRITCFLQEVPAVTCPGNFSDKSATPEVMVKTRNSSRVGLWRYRKSEIRNRKKTEIVKNHKWHKNTKGIDRKLKRKVFVIFWDLESVSDCFPVSLFRVLPEKRVGERPLNLNYLITNNPSSHRKQVPGNQVRSERSHRCWTVSG